MVGEVSVMTVVWRLKAVLRLDEVTTWCYWRFGERVALKFYKEARRRADLLGVFPRMAPIEASLAHYSRGYRSLSMQPHFKFIYYVDEAKLEIHVVDFWDTRQDPESLVEGLAEE